MSCQRARLAFALLPLCLGLAACTAEVHIELQPGPDCDPSIMQWDSVLSGDAQLLRLGDGLTVQSSCVRSGGGLGSVGDLEALFRGTVVFNDLPSEGSWTVRIRGYFTDSCVVKTTLVCGRVDGIDLSGVTTIVLPVDCAPRVSTDPPAPFKHCIEEF